MRYTKPNYETEVIEANDIILASIDLGNGATLVDKGDGSAQVGASVNDILGLR